MDNLQDESDGEVLALAQSDEIEEEDEYESNDDAQHQYRSSQDSPPLEDVMEDIMEAGDESHPHEYFSSKCAVHVFDLGLISFFIYSVIRVLATFGTWPGNTVEL